MRRRSSLRLGDFRSPSDRRRTKEGFSPHTVSVFQTSPVPMRIRALLTACCLLVLPSFLPAADSRLADWVEPDFPFFSSVLDARKAQDRLAPKNLTPRGLVLNLGQDCWVCFDTDLLRVAAVWRGQGVTPRALAPGSYHKPDEKSPGGQFPAPEPAGTVWLVNGIYPGWQTGARPSLDDPREPAPSPEEVGRGPLTEEQGRLQAVRLVGRSVVLEYTAGGAKVSEWLSVADHAGQPAIVRNFELEPSTRARLLVLGLKSKSAPTAVSLGLTPGSNAAELLNDDALWIVRVPANTTPVRFCAAISAGGPVANLTPQALPNEAPVRRWPQEATTHIKRSTASDAYVVDDVDLPTVNPWRRDIRIADIQFLKDGTGFGITIDGDVWKVTGLHSPAGPVHWRRFASGLHEPMTLVVRDEQLYAFDRNGIWRLRDTNGDSEADVHELFSNAFAQTADMREFPSAIRLAPGGEFVIAKGGQQSTTLGKHNGSILRISADGRQATVLGYGFRQPNLGVNVRTGLVLASDQQGQYVPSTPLHIVRDAQFYGFLSPKLPREKYPAPIADPLTWIPHPVDSSAISLLWLFDAKLGPLDDSLVHLGFRRPELFRVLLNNRGLKPQASVVSVTRAFEFPPLTGSVNPADGQLYIAGFQVLGWGTDSTRIAGLGRVRYTGAPSVVPRDVVPMDQGVLLRFDVELSPEQATDPKNYSLASWQYQRTYKYGSPQLKADGTPGMDWLGASSAYLSKDGRSVFVGVPRMKPVMQMRVGWSIATKSGKKFEENAYFTPYDLPKFDPVAEGFGNIAVDLSSEIAVAKAATTPETVEEGRRLYQLFGCLGCHSIDAQAFVQVGPVWKGLYGKTRSFGPDIGDVTADEAYLRESILEPTAKIVPGFAKSDAGMPSYAGVLTDPQINALILFIKSLK